MNPLKSQLLKSTIDRLLAILGLVITSPVFIVIAVVLKLQKQDVFFRHERTGYHLESFQMYKFTTMIVGSEKQGTLTIEQDRRITLTGRFLRKFKLNEIPQFINVLKGEMSFVGPRPLALSEVEAHYPQKIREKIYSVKPGITGCGSLEFSQEEISLGNEDSPEKYFAEVIMPKKAELECWYVENWDLILDAKIFHHTIFKLLLSFIKFFINRLKSSLSH